MENLCLVVHRDCHYCLDIFNSRLCKRRNSLPYCTIGIIMYDVNFDISITHYYNTICFFRFLKLLSDNALNDRLLIVLTSLLFIFPSNISEFDLPIFDNIIIVYIFHYGFAFVTTILLDKFSVLDKLRAAFKKRKNKVSRKHEI